MGTSVICDIKKNTFNFKDNLASYKRHIPNHLFIGCYQTEDCCGPIPIYLLHVVQSREVKERDTSQRIMNMLQFLVGARLAQSVYQLATGWAVRGSNPGVGEIFRTRPDRPWGPHSLLYNGYWVFPED